MKKVFVFTMLFCLFAFTAQAMTDGEMDFTCPVDGHQFTVRLPVSAASHGTTLDLRPLGPMPVPWLRAECPNDGYVFFTQDLTPEELAILPGYINSEEYQQLRETDVTYWRIAKIMEKLGRPLEGRHWCMLSATWEAMTDDQYERYARADIKALQELLNSGAYDKSEENEKEGAQMLIGELHRRLNDFAEAEAIFVALRKDPAISGNEGFMLIVDRELELIAAKDNDIHERPYPEKK